MKKLLRKLFIEIPWWSWLISVGLFCIQGMVYHLSDSLAQALGTIERAFEPVIPSIDYKIPFIPFFIFFYFLSYPSWMLGFAIIGKLDREKYINFVFGVLISLFLGFIIMSLFPSKLDRAGMGVLEIVSERKGFMWWVCREVYKADGWERGYNALPSFHCMMSTFCLLPLVKEKKISKGFKIYSVIAAFLVWISTLFTRQHFVLDIPAGILLAVLGYGLSKWINPGRRMLAKYPKLQQKEKSSEEIK